MLRKEVLCLAAGGGQQSSVFGLLGARVTAVDLTEAQLVADRKAAEHYGYNITTLRGDMRDLSGLPIESFDLVYHGPSMGYIPDVRQVYSGFSRRASPSNRSTRGPITVGQTRRRSQEAGRINKDTWRESLQLWQGNAPKVFSTDEGQILWLTGSAAQERLRSIRLT